MSGKRTSRRSGIRPGRACRAVILLTFLGAASAHAFDYGRDPRPLFQLGSHQPGASPTHALSFSGSSGELKTYRAIMTYPPEFRFNGFEALGPPGTQVGVLSLDLNGDGAPDHIVPLHSLGSRLAYADVIGDGRFSPQLEPMVGYGDGTLVLHLPFGGDANRDTVTVAVDARVTVALFAGAMTNPPQAGTYVITAELTSVDPDTGDADDGAGQSPLTLSFELSVAIEGTTLEPFAMFCIDVARIHDGFTVQGRFRLGRGSDGIDLSREQVTLRFGDFEQAVPGSGFVHGGASFARFLAEEPGITRFELGPGGLFRVEAGGADVGVVDPQRPVPLRLVIGNDQGEAYLLFDRHGRLRGPRPCMP